jgi:hypothetical protein
MDSKAPLQHVPPAPGACKLQLERKEKQQRKNYDPKLEKREKGKN